MRGLLTAGLLVCVILTANCDQGMAQAPQPKAAAEWPQFLGPQRNGISAETGLLQTWPAAGPKELWRTTGGPGMSGLAISRGHVITMVHRAGKQSVISVDASTGKPRWESVVAPEYHNGMGNGPRATPAISGDQVFVFTGEGILAALNLSDGKLVWSHNVVKDLDGEIAEYGMASSPLVVGKQVIVIAGAPQAAIVAYDTGSGKLAWKIEDGAAGYSSPALLNIGGTPQIVASTGGAVFGIAPERGSLLWKYPFETNYNCNIATPLAVKSNVFISAGENHGSVLLALEPQGDQFKAKEVWSSLGTKSVLRNEWQTSILHDGHLYGFDNVGAAGPVRHLTCINAETGARVWQKVRFGKGNMIAADGKLFATTMNGELVMIHLSSKGYEELGRSTVMGSTRQAPALANGKLYLRDEKEIICLDVRQP